MVEFLIQLVEAESPTVDPDSQRVPQQLLTERLESLGFRVRRYPGETSGGMLLARPADRVRGSPIQLLIGHSDTVWPSGTIADMPARTEDGRVYGPGSFDMKGGLVQLILAIKTIRSLDLEPGLLPLIFVNADEEIGSRTSTRYIRKLARLASRALILEPALGDQGSLKTERKGIGRFTFTVFGKAAHAGLDPEAGASAILELSHVIQKLFAMNDPDKGITINVGTIDGGVQPNVVAAHSTAVVDVRVPTIADGDRVEKLIHGIKPEIPGVRLRIEGAIGRPSMESTPRNEALWDSALAIGKQLNIELSRARVGGGSDGNTTSQYTATLDGLGPVGHGAHAEHEFLYIDKTLERAALLTMLLLSPPTQVAALKEAG